MSGIASGVIGLLTIALEMADKYIEDPKRRLEARLEIKEKYKKKAVELINKEYSGEEADEMALALLADIDTL